MLPKTTTLPRPLLAAALCLAAWAAAVPARAADGPPTLDEALAKQAPQVMQYLQGKKYHNVGVLKFLVKNAGRLDDNAGPINLSLANRMEVALALAADPEQPIGLIERASAVVVQADNMRANHLTRDGRAAFFDLEYPLAWGRDRVKADAFVTGFVELDPASRVLKVTVQAFDNRDFELREVCTFTTAATVRTYAELGREFLVQGAKGAPVKQLRKAEDLPAKEKLVVVEASPLDQKDLVPVEVKVLYDGKDVPVVRGQVKEPNEKQTVSFKLKNWSKQRFGVVLLVNGLNTIYRERLAPEACHKWILDADEEIEVRGFQLRDEQKAERFTVKPPSHSDADEVRYNEHLGTFTLVVFAEGQKDAVKPVEDEAQRKVGRISKGVLSEGKARPMSLAALQSQLKAALGEGGKGFIIHGPKEKNEVEQVEFITGPAVMLATVRYYTPK